MTTSKCYRSLEGIHSSSYSSAIFKKSPTATMACTYVCSTLSNNTQIGNRKDWVVL